MCRTISKAAGPMMLDVKTNHLHKLTCRVWLATAVPALAPTPPTGRCSTASSTSSSSLSDGKSSAHNAWPPGP